MHSDTLVCTISFYKQVGNAVPPPMAKAIGVEIKKAVLKKKIQN